MILPPVASLNRDRYFLTLRRESAMFSRLQLIAAAVVVALASSVSADGWGTIKGQFVMHNGQVPPLVKLNINKDQDHCLKKQEFIANEKYVVDPKTKGVRWI